MASNVYTIEGLKREEASSEVEALARVDKLKCERDELRTLLRRYGGHTEACRGTEAVAEIARIVDSEDSTAEMRVPVSKGGTSRRDQLAIVDDVAAYIGEIRDAARQDVCEAERTTEEAEARALAAEEETERLREILEALGYGTVAIDMASVAADPASALLTFAGTV